MPDLSPVPPRSPLGAIRPTVRVPRPVDPGALRLARTDVCVDQDRPGVTHPPRDDGNPSVRVRSDGTLVGVVRQPLVGETAKMWNLGTTLRIRFVGGSARLRDRVREIAREWTRHANLNFAFVGDHEPGELKVGFLQNGRHESMVGRDALGIPFDPPTMNLSVTEDLDEEDLRAVVLHEFGHALGLRHEHQSPAAGIPWDVEKVYASYAKLGFSRAEVDHNVFRRYAAQHTNYTAWDPASIMQYPVSSDLTLDGSSVPFNTELSAVDKEFIARWYPSRPTPATARGLLRTGDDCDEIDFEVRYGTGDPFATTIELVGTPAAFWWKAVEVPTFDGPRLVATENQVPGSVRVLTSRLATEQPLRFHKAKFLGVHTRLDFTWDVLPALTGGTRLSLRWKRDHC